MTEEHFKSIKRIICPSCGQEVRALASEWLLSLGEEGRAYLTDAEIAAQFHPEAHTLPSTINIRCM